MQFPGLCPSISDSVYLGGAQRSASNEHPKVMVMQVEESVGTVMKKTESKHFWGLHHLT